MLAIYNVKFTNDGTRDKIQVHRTIPRDNPIPINKPEDGAM